MQSYIKTTADFEVYAPGLDLFNKLREREEAYGRKKKPHSPYGWSYTEELQMKQRTES